MSDPYVFLEKIDERITNKQFWYAVLARWNTTVRANASVQIELYEKYDFQSSDNYINSDFYIWLQKSYLFRLVKCYSLVLFMRQQLNGYLGLIIKIVN